MSRFRTPRLAAVLAVIALPVLAVPAVALAQSSPSAPPPAAAPKAESSPPAVAPAPTLPKAQSKRVEQHIKQLHDQLGITTAEEPQWTQFAQVMRDNAAQMEQAFSARGAHVDAMNAADNMQSYAQLAQVHATNMQKLASSFQSLYNSFPDAQKKVADTVFKKSDGRHHRGHK